MAGDGNNMQVYMSEYTVTHTYIHTHKRHKIPSLICTSFTWIAVCDCGVLKVAVWYFQYVVFHRGSVWLWPRFLWGNTHCVTTYCSVCGYCSSVYYVWLCVCVCARACMHIHVGARIFGFYNCPCHIFRGDDKRREMSCLSERVTNYCLVFLLVQKSFKNTNDCIFMVVTLHAGLLLCSAEMIPLEATEF